MGGAQFIVLPPLTKVAALFTASTGRPMFVDVEWKAWCTVPSAEIEAFRQYIRPSHRKVLDDTVSGENPTPCTFLRQLLRPHDYRIETTSSGWILKKGKPEEAHGVRVGSGRVVDWAM